MRTDLWTGDQLKSLLYVLRDIVIASFFYTFAYHITPFVDNICGILGFTSPLLKVIAKASLWCTYWVLQSLVGAGIFCLGAVFHFLIPEHLLTI
jgi:omega-6 fatty acid desaturase (delta-12 desaturase)